MTSERNEESYSGPKLRPDSRKVIYDSDIAKLPESVQQVYLNGGYHTLVSRVMRADKSTNRLSAEEQAFFRNRLARELVDCTFGAHFDKTPASRLIDYFDSKAEFDHNIGLSRLARILAVVYVQSK